MLTYRFHHGAAAALFALALLSQASAQAGWTGSTSCIGGWGTRTCVSNFRELPRDPHVRDVRGNDGHPYSEEAIERDRHESQSRDRRWLAFCKPEIVKDRYGVERYLYARPGCEFGRSE